MTSEKGIHFTNVNLVYI